MAAKLGRKVLLEWGGIEIPGVQEKGINRNGEAVDITSDDDDGWQRLHDEAGMNSVEITVSGVSKSEDLAADWHAGTRTKLLEITNSLTGSVLAGQFFMASYNETATHNEAVTFEATFQSTGTVTFTGYS
jgi:predicted secreted protein